MNPAEVVEEKVEGQVGLVIFPLLREGIGEPLFVRMFRQHTLETLPESQIHNSSPALKEEVGHAAHGPPKIIEKARKPGQ